MILVVDNYDSFTYNLVQMLLRAGAEVEVVRNDAEPAPEMLARAPRGVVLSPGPGRPENAGACLELFAARPAVPVLGVCLGHQALGASFGGVVERSPRPMHGKTSRIRHRQVGVFAGLPNPFVATRYHSLELRQEGLPRALEPLAWSDDGALMGMRHRELPYWGVQFHPESVLTSDGERLMANFLELCGEPAAARAARG